RHAIVLQKGWAMALQALLLAATVTACVLAGRGFQLTVGPGHALAVAAALTLMGLDFGLITMAAGAATGRRGTALGIGTGLAAASYLLSSLAATISEVRARPVPVALLLVGGQRPDQQGSQHRRLHGPDRDRPLRSHRCRRRVPPGRPQL